MNNKSLNNSEETLFSTKELEIINDTDFFRLKSTVTQKFYQLFGKLIHEIKAEKNLLNFDFPKGMDITNGKITKGENYLGLPYVVADFPKIFNQQGVFTFRMWFWWGNYILFSWHLSGDYLIAQQKFLISKFEDFKKADFLIFIGTDEWQQHISKGSYLALKNVSKTDYEKLITKPFFKICQKIEFQNIEKVIHIGKNTLKTFIN
jgi:hypothetical protein